MMPTQSWNSNLQCKLSVLSCLQSNTVSAPYSACSLVCAMDCQSVGHNKSQYIPLYIYYMLSSFIRHIGHALRSSHRAKLNLVKPANAVCHLIRALRHDTMGPKIATYRIPFNSIWPVISFRCARVSECHYYWSLSHMSNKDHKSSHIWEYAPSQSFRSVRSDGYATHHSARTPSASVRVFPFISITYYVWIGWMGEWRRICIGFMVRVYFIGFIEYQGQIFALKSNILKYSTSAVYASRS